MMLDLILLAAAIAITPASAGLWGRRSTCITCGDSVRRCRPCSRPHRAGVETWHHTTAA